VNLKEEMYVFVCLRMDSSASGEGPGGRGDSWPITRLSTLNKSHAVWN